MALQVHGSAWPVGPSDLRRHHPQDRSDLLWREGETWLASEALMTASESSSSSSASPSWRPSGSPGRRWHHPADPQGYAVGGRRHYW
jgi:hypothetical protein